MVDDLPLIDEHSVAVRADPDETFVAVRRRFDRMLSGPLGSVFSRLWGCEPVSAFEIVAEQPPSLLVVAGKHRFSRYGIVFRIAPTAAGSKLSAESRAAFPGMRGRAYRAAVVTSRLHVLATRWLLRNIANGVEH